MEPDITFDRCRSGEQVDFDIKSARVVFDASWHARDIRGAELGHVRRRKIFDATEMQSQSLWIQWTQAQRSLPVFTLVRVI